MITDCTLWRYQIKIVFFLESLERRGEGSSVKTAQCGGIIVKTSHCAVEGGGGGGGITVKTNPAPMGRGLLLPRGCCCCPPPRHKSPPGYRKVYVCFMKYFEATAIRIKNNI